MYRALHVGGVALLAGIAFWSSALAVKLVLLEHAPDWEIVGLTFAPPLILVPTFELLFIYFRRYLDRLLYAVSIIGGLWTFGPVYAWATSMLNVGSFQDFAIEDILMLLSIPPLSSVAIATYDGMLLGLLIITAYFGIAVYRSIDR